MHHRCGTGIRIASEHLGNNRSNFLKCIFLVSPASNCIWHLSASCLKLGSNLLDNYRELSFHASVLTMPNDPKLSHGHWSLTPKCNCDNQISWLVRN